MNDLFDRKLNAKVGRILQRLDLGSWETRDGYSTILVAQEIENLVNDLMIAQDELAQAKGLSNPEDESGRYAYIAEEWVIK